MSECLTSSESLERLCKLQPDKPIKYGIGKVLAGIGLTGMGGGAGFVGWEIRGMVTNSYHTIGQVVGVGLEVILGIFTLASGGYGLYMLADGATSLGKPLGIYSRDGTAYYRNGGFTNKPSAYDKKFGSKVTPIEHTSELNYDKKFGSKVSP